jgi:hypothetical protein
MAVMPRKPRKRPPGHGTIWQQGGNWWIRWRERGRRRSAKFPSRDLAEQVLAKVIAELAAGRAGLPPDPRTVPKLHELAEAGLERR